MPGFGRICRIALGVNEMAEGLISMAVSEGMAEGSVALDVKGVIDVAAGLSEVAVAEAELGTASVLDTAAQIDEE